eukprot:scaffold7215_cov366-Prasinococcus_capsulatus_cf.AAC.19
MPAPQPRSHNKQLHWGQPNGSPNAFAAGHRNSTGTARGGGRDPCSYHEVRVRLHSCHRGRRPHPIGWRGDRQNNLRYALRQHVGLVA